MITSIDQVKTAYKKLVKQYGQYVFEIEQLQQDAKRKAEQIASQQAIINDLNLIIDDLRADSDRYKEQHQEVLDRLAVYENEVISEAVEIDYTQSPTMADESLTAKPTRRGKKKDNDE